MRLLEACHRNPFWLFSGCLLISAGFGLLSTLTDWWCLLPIAVAPLLWPLYLAKDSRLAFQRLPWFRPSGKVASKSKPVPLTRSAQPSEFAAAFALRIEECRNRGAPYWVAVAYAFSKNGVKIDDPAKLRAQLNGFNTGRPDHDTKN